MRIFKYSTVTTFILASLLGAFAFANDVSGFSLLINNDYQKKIHVQCFAKANVTIDKQTKPGERDFTVASGGTENVTGTYAGHIKDQEQDIIGCWALGYDAYLTMLVQADAQEFIDTSDANPGFVVDDAGTGLVNFQNKSA